MKNKTIHKDKKAKMSEDKELAELIHKAQQQPGIREVMDIYRQYQIIDKTVRPYTQLLGIKRVVSLSDNSQSVL